MRNKTIISWFNILSIVILETLSIFLITLLDPNDDKYIAQLIALIVCAILYPIFLNDYYFCTTLAEDTITFKHKFTGNKQQIQVGSINRFVIDVATIEVNAHGWLIVYANQQKGQILGVGNAALLALLKSYPHIRVVIKKITLQLSRRVAKYLVKHKRTTRHQCEELCEYYHLPKSLLEQSESENN